LGKLNIFVGLGGTTRKGTLACWTNFGIVEVCIFYWCGRYCYIWSFGMVFYFIISYYSMQGI